MHPINFKQANLKLIPAKGTEDRVQDLKVYYDGMQTISCWQFTDEEWGEMSKTKSLYIGQFHGEAPAPPIRPYTEFPETVGLFEECICYFKPKEEGLLGIHIYNAGASGVPSVVTFNGNYYYFSPQELRPTKVKGYEIAPGTLYFRKGNDYELQARFTKTVKDFNALKITDEKVINDFHQSLVANHSKISVLVERLENGKDKLHI